MPLKRTAVLSAARALRVAARLSGRGGGTALPGLLVERAAPELIGDLARDLGAGVLLVTGTNGKTTTSRLLALMLSHAGYRVVHNRSGSNLIRGMAATLAQYAGEIRANRSASIGLFETDEATIPQAIRLLKPRLLLVLNLFRDQLDRYGEVDTVARLWRDALRHLPPSATVVLNADDPLVASLGRGLVCRTVYFGVDDPHHALRERERAADFVECLDCARPFDYERTYYGHLGHYRCPGCGWSRPVPDVKATCIALDGLQAGSARLSYEGAEAGVSLPLPGLYNQYNLLAAAAAAVALGFSLEDVQAGVRLFRPAFGRGERFEIDGRYVTMLLTKNPVGANQVLRLLQLDPAPKPLLLALNDGLADGQDISWTWDADYEELAGHAAWVITSGRRAADMALRLKYAGWFDPPGGGNAGAPFREAHDEDGGTATLLRNAALRPLVLPDPGQALQTALYRLNPGETLYILATYTAMLEIRETLARMARAKPFWEEE